MEISYKPNPILPNDTFVPDVEAHVWEDGRVYLYGSFDLQGKLTYCSDEYHVYSSDNMVDWVDHGVSFRLADTDWAKDLGALYAPDCAYRNGIYYLYYCVPDGRCGVAKSDKPYGPFTDIGPIANVHGIDPAVLIDDDGQAYLYWGQFDKVRVAKLKENMIEIEPDSAVQPLSVREHEFHEGSSVKKIGGNYYFLFTDTHRHGNRATSLGYAVSDNPMTGFRYGGVILDNFGCDPETWNNHGSMECVNGQWYLFYHRSTHGSVNSRHVCVEPITIEADGTIREVKMTSSASSADSGIDAGQTIPACLACEMTGRVRIAGDDSSAHVLNLREIRPGDSAVYRYLDFHGENTFTADLRTDGKCRVEVWLDGWYHTSLDARKGSAAMEPVTGIHEVTLKFYGDFTDAVLDEFSFEIQ
ncbi:MAG: family 43 glycosylhydrolase [Clostridia bacterium]|nr:family 43 glycosylhydrolase [Clostridia bacterium]